MHLIHYFKQVLQRRVADYFVTPVHRLRFVTATGTGTGQYFRVWLVQNPGIGIAFANRLQQLQVAADAVGAKADRCIVFHLPCDQNHPFGFGRSHPGLAGQVVFGHPCTANSLAQGLCPHLQRIFKGIVKQDAFQARRASSVVIDTQVVHDPGQRPGLARAESDRA